MSEGRLFSISISAGRGQLKQEVPTAKVIAGFGIENDGHGGDWGRQVTCLNRASVLRIDREKNLKVKPGEYAENLLIEGLDFARITVGSKLSVGLDVVLEVSQIGKEDHPSVVTRTLGVSLLPYEGLFCRVIAGGTIEKGDKVSVL